MSIAIYGIGNVLLGDDAVGPTVAEILAARWELPADVTVEDLGTPSLDLTDYLVGKDCVIFIDAVSEDAEPGTVCTYDRSRILKHGPGLRLTPHDPSLRETLLSLEFTGDGPSDVLLIGVVPNATKMAEGLSEEVTDALPLVVELIRTELERRGVEVVEREQPLPLRLWWAETVQ